MPNRCVELPSPQQHHHLTDAILDAGDQHCRNIAIARRHEGLLLLWRYYCPEVARYFPADAGDSSCRDSAITRRMRGTSTRRPRGVDISVVVLLPNERGRFPFSGWYHHPIDAGNFPLRAGSTSQQTRGITIAAVVSLPNRRGGLPSPWGYNFSADARDLSCRSGTDIRQT